MSRLDLDFVRRQFPTLAGEWTYFDNAGGSQILQSVVDRIEEYLLGTNVQLGATYEISARAGERVADVAKTMATLINAADPTEVVMGPSTSMLLRILSLGLARLLRPGDEIIVTNCDHEANIGPWMDLTELGIQVKVWEIEPDRLVMDLSRLEALLSERTRLVAVTHVSNILGTINPIRRIADLVHDAGAMICVDAVAYAPHRLVDVQALDVDFYAFSFYKTYGPHYAMLYGKRQHLLETPGINHYFIGDTALPQKFQPGSVNYELSYGMMGLADYLSACAEHHLGAEAPDDLRGRAAAVFDHVAAHEHELSRRLLDFLDGKPRVRIIGARTSDPNARVPTVSFVVEGVNSDTIPPEVDKHRIGIRFGDFYARRLIEALGLAGRGGVVRVSMVHYNTLAEVDRLIEVLDPLV